MYNNSKLSVEEQNIVLVKTTKATVFVPQPKAGFYNATIMSHNWDGLNGSITITINVNGCNITNTFKGAAMGPTIQDVVNLTEVSGTPDEIFEQLKVNKTSIPVHIEPNETVTAKGNYAKYLNFKFVTQSDYEHQQKVIADRAANNKSIR